MGQFREYNPKMESEWHQIAFPNRPSDRAIETNAWGGTYHSWSGYINRREEAVEWCKGAMIHGRFSYKNILAGSFYFKSKRDAMTFKLAYSID
jgi:hypothetical protein